MRRVRDGPGWDAWSDESGWYMSIDFRKEAKMATKKKSKKKTSSKAAAPAPEVSQGSASTLSADNVCEAFARGAESFGVFDPGELSKFQGRLDAIAKRHDALLRDMRTAAKVLNKRAADKAAKIAAAEAYIRDNS